MSKLYAQVVGIVLLLVGIIGLFTSKLLGVNTTVVHNVIHLVSGAIGAYTGFSGSGSRVFAQVFGVVYTVVGLIGFASPGTLAALGVPVNTSYNLVHLVIGLWGMWAGFSREMATA